VKGLTYLRLEKKKRVKEAPCCGNRGSGRELGVTGNGKVGGRHGKLKGGNTYLHTFVKPEKSQGVALGRERAEGAPSGSRVKKRVPVREEGESLPDSFMTLFE